MPKEWAEKIARAPALLAEVERLRAALGECVESLSRIPDVEGAYRVTVLQGARAALSPSTGEPDDRTGK